MDLKYIFTSKQRREFARKKKDISCMKRKNERAQDKLDTSNKSEKSHEKYNVEGILLKAIM